VPEPGHQCPHVPWDASACAKAAGDADSPGQLAAPAPASVPGREETRNGISPYVSSPPEELLYYMARKKHTRPRCRPNSDTATFEPPRGIYTQITNPEVARMVNQVTNRILGLDGEVEPGSVQ
jgi:hypothetical protein